MTRSGTEEGILNLLKIKGREYAPVGVQKFIETKFYNFNKTFNQSITCRSMIESFFKIIKLCFNKFML